MLSIEEIKLLNETAEELEKTDNPDKMLNIIETMKSEYKDKFM